MALLCMYSQLMELTIEMTVQIHEMGSKNNFFLRKYRSKYAADKKSTVSLLEQSSLLTVTCRV
jgi:hypothetical protein